MERDAIDGVWCRVGRSFSHLGVGGLCPRRKVRQIFLHSSILWLPSGIISIRPRHITWSKRTESIFEGKGLSEIEYLVDAGMIASARRTAFLHFLSMHMSCALSSPIPSTCFICVAFTNLHIQLVSYPPRFFHCPRLPIPRITFL